MNEKCDFHGQMIENIKNICDVKYDECTELKKQFYRCRIRTAK
jgi:hypothetical protein